MFTNYLGYVEYDGRSITCPHCGNPNCNEDQSFCTNCGRYLHNTCCGDESCEANGLNLDVNDCYCPECGSETLFFRSNYISPVDFTASDLATGDPQEAQ